MSPSRDATTAALAASGFNPAVERVAPSAIRELQAYAAGFPDVLSAWFGETLDRTPAAIVEAASDALARGETRYVENTGLPALREEISRTYSRLQGLRLDPERVVVTASGMHGLSIALRTLLTQGDEAVVITPLWSNVGRVAELSGAALVETPLRATGSGWHLDVEAVAKACTARTRVLIVNTPNNPTGWVASREEQRSLLDLCRRRGIWLVADEVYDRLVLDGTTAPSFLTLADPHDRLVVVNSFSKAYAMTGWRLGWLVAPAAMVPLLAKLIEYTVSCAPPFIQAAGVAALRSCDDYVADLTGRLRAARDEVAAALGSVPGIRFTPPPATMYAFFEVAEAPGRIDLARGLIDEGRVGLAPGYAFGPGGERHLRMCFALPPDRLGEALSRTTRGLSRLLAGRPGASS